MDDVSQARFDRQVQILASLDHPTLLSLRGFSPPASSSPSDPPAIVTNFVTGGSLQQLVDAGKKGKANRLWDDTHRLIVLYGIAVGMAVLHSKRIIHRDLKPSHILLNVISISQ
jgi:serine/threonine protein kinase